MIHKVGTCVYSHLGTQKIPIMYVSALFQFSLNNVRHVLQKKIVFDMSELVRNLVHIRKYPHSRKEIR